MDAPLPVGAPARTALPLSLIAATTGACARLEMSVCQVIVGEPGSPVATIHVAPSLDSSSADDPVGLRTTLAIPDAPVSVELTTLSNGFVRFTLSPVSVREARTKPWCGKPAKICRELSTEIGCPRKK